VNFRVPMEQTFYIPVTHYPNRYYFNTLSCKFKGNVKIINKLSPRLITLHGQNVGFSLPYETTPTNTWEIFI
jgi:hypothetical protein